MAEDENPGESQVPHWSDPAGNEIRETAAALQSNLEDSMLYSLLNEALNVFPVFQTLESTEERGGFPAESPGAAEEQILMMRSALREFRKEILAANREGRSLTDDSPEVQRLRVNGADHLRNAINEYRKAFSLARNASPTALEAIRKLDAATTRIEQISMIAEVRKSHREASRAAERALEALAANEAALEVLKAEKGLKAETELAAEFETLRDTERDRARFYRGATFVALGAAVAAVALVAQLTKATNAEIAALSVAALAIAGYAGRLADGHASTARWASTRVVQLRSIHGYSRQLDEDGRLRLLESFGTTTFLETPTSHGGEVPPSTLAEIERALGELRDRRSGADGKPA